MSDHSIRFDLTNAEVLRCDARYSIVALPRSVRVLRDGVALCVGDVLEGGDMVRFEAPSIAGFFPSTSGPLVTVSIPPELLDLSPQVADGARDADDDEWPNGDEE